MILECAASLPGAAQPDETALSLQAGNRERFHVKHGHRGRQSGDFVVRFPDDSVIGANSYAVVAVNTGSFLL